jgi:hypothetical protein
VAGKHRKSARHRARHRKPPTVAQRSLPAGTAVAVLAVGGVFLGQSFANGQSPAPAHATSPPHVAVLAFHATRPAIDKPARVQHPQAHHRSPYSLMIADTGSPCYVQVTNRHGKVLVRRILRGRQHLTFRRHGLDVVIGNAGAVRVAVDSARFHRAGSLGQVRHFRLR